MAKPLLLKRRTELNTVKVIPMAMEVELTAKIFLFPSRQISTAYSSQSERAVEYWLLRRISPLLGVGVVSVILTFFIESFAQIREEFEVRQR